MINNLTPQEHWDLNQGLWRMLGCDMELKKKYRNTIVYVDRKTDRYYSYSSTLGSIYLGRQPLRGVEGKEEEELLTGVLDVKPDHDDWARQSKKFWSDMHISVPFEGVNLDISTDENGKPFNKEDYMKYKFAVKHPQVALNKNDMTSKHRFYIHDTTRDLIKKNNEIQVRKDADKEFIKVTADDKKMTRILRLLTTDISLHSLEALFIKL